MEQFYKIYLTDYALPGFCSGGVKYYGTMDELREFIMTVAEKQGKDLDGLKAALESFLAGEQDVQHNVAYDYKPFLTPVEIKSEVAFNIGKIEWTHINIYGYPYYMKADEGTISEVILKDGDTYVKCAKAELKNLMYKSDPPIDHWRKLDGGFWGFPELLLYNKDKDTTFSALYYVERESKEEDDPALTIGDVKELLFEEFCNNIFGDG